MTDREYRALCGHTARQYRHHRQISRLIAFDRLLMVAAILACLGLGAASYVTTVQPYVAQLTRALTLNPGHTP